MKFDLNDQVRDAASIYAHLRKLAIACAVVAVLPACGLQTEKILISYQSQEQTERLADASGTSVQVEVKDTRSNKTEVSKKGDEYEFLAPILVENDVAQVLENAISEELANRGFDMEDGGAIVVAELRKFYNRFRASSSEAEVFIHAQVKTSAGNLVHSEIVEGKGVLPNVMVRSGKNAKVALEVALRDAVYKLTTNRAFLDAVIQASQG